MDFLFSQEVASAGNGGGANSAADGGAAATSDINSGANMGSAIGVGDTVGSASVNGGAMANTTNVMVDTLGGTAISDASGGDMNVAFVS